MYDGDWKDYNTGLYFVSQIVKLRDAGIPTYLITGNHDAQNKMTKSLLLPENPNKTKMMLSSCKVETIVLDDLGVAIHGRGFTSSKVSENVVKDYPARRDGMFNIGVLHTSLANWHEGHACRRGRAESSFRATLSGASNERRSSVTRNRICDDNYTEET